MRRCNVVGLGIVALTVLVACGCTQPPTGVYQEDSGWLGIHTISTDSAGVISGTLAFRDTPIAYFPAACQDITYTIAGVKGSSIYFDEEVFYRAIADVELPDGCPEDWWMDICFYLDDTGGEADGWLSMDGRIADCSAFPINFPVEMDGALILNQE